MSKSIKDYKDAMDNVKISDSFYKRTEVLLSELSEMEIEKKPLYGGRHITAFIMTAAACLACVIGVRVMVDGRRDDIAVDTAGITDMITSEEVTISTLPLIDDLDGGGDDNMLVDEDDIDALPTEGQEGIAESENPDRGGKTAAAESTENGSSSAVTGSVGDKPDGGQNIPMANPKADFEGGIPSIQHNDGSTGAAADGGANGAAHTANAVPAEGYPEISENDSGVENIPGLRDTAAEVITVEITPYFDMGSIKSGEGSVKMNGAECLDIIGYIAEISENSHEMGSYSFKSVFMVQISDENIGATYYSIYITDRNALIINKHMAGGQQRATYGVRDEDYNALMRRLFNLFGSDEDYELFDTLISGK